MSAVPSRARVLVGKLIGRLERAPSSFPTGEGVGVIRLSGLDPRVQALLGVQFLTPEGDTVTAWSPDDLLTLSVYAKQAGCQGREAVYGPIPGYDSIPLMPSIVMEGDAIAFATNMCGVETKTTAAELIGVIKYNGGDPDESFNKLGIYACATVSMENGEDEEEGNEILARVNLSVDRGFDRSFGGGE